MPLVRQAPGELYRQLPQAWCPAAITRHIVLVMAALATCAVTAALLKDRTDTQAPPPATPDRLRRKTPGMTPLTVPEIRRVRAAAFQRPAPARPRHALAELATPSPRPLVLVPPAHPAKSRQCPGQLANGGCRIR